MLGVQREIVFLPMTLLAAWVGVDNNRLGPKISSLYIASDSRMSWGIQEKFDGKQKVLGMVNHPDIFGYCGDINFTENILNQIVQHGDSNLLFPKHALPDDKFDIIGNKIESALSTYPKNLISQPFSLIYATRDLFGHFHAYKFSWSKSKGLESSKIQLPLHSDIIFVAGSGREDFLKKWHSAFDLSAKNNFRTCRAVYHCFTETLDQTEVYSVGGPPQIVGLYRKFNAQFFGIIQNEKKYFKGTEVLSTENLNFVQWRNELFERCDPESLTLLMDAQRQPKQ